MAINLLVGAFLSACHFIFLAFNFNFPSELFFGHFKWVGATEVIVCFIFFILNFIFRRKYLSYLILSNVDQNFVINRHEQQTSGQLIILIWILILTSLIFSYFGAFVFLSLMLPHIVSKLPILKNHFILQLEWGPWICGFLILILDQICYYFPFFGMEIPTGMLTNMLASFLMILLLLNANKSIKA